MINNYERLRKQYLRYLKESTSKEGWALAEIQPLSIRHTSMKIKEEKHAGAEGVNADYGLNMK